MGFHLNSQERLGSGLFRTSLPAVNETKIPNEFSIPKLASEPSKPDTTPIEEKPAKLLSQPIIS
jgi:hypothetical protein